MLTCGYTMTKSRGIKRKLSDGPEPYQAVNWAFTMNNYLESEWDFIKGLGGDSRPYQYLAVQCEVAPTTGTPHLQGVVIFTKKLTRLAVQKIMSPERPTWFITSPCYASIAANQQYCTKEGGADSIIDGSLKDTQDPSKLDADGRAEILLQLAEAQDWGTLRREHPSAYLYNRTQLTNAGAAKIDAPDMLDGVLDNYWIFGSARKGKDMYARHLAPTAYSKGGNSKWWTDYKGEEDVILRDVGQSVMGILDLFKDWTDRYKFSCEWKNGGGSIRPRRMLVTSNLHPSKLHGIDAESLDAIIGRFRFIRVFKDGTSKEYPRRLTEKPALLTPVLVDYDYGCGPEAEEEL